MSPVGDTPKVSADPRIGPWAATPTPVLHHLPHDTWKGSEPSSQHRVLDLKSSLRQEDTPVWEEGWGPAPQLQEEVGRAFSSCFLTKQPTGGGERWRVGLAVVRP